MRALVSLTIQRKLRTNMRRKQFLGYSPQPGCSGRHAGCVFGESTFVIVWITCDCPVLIAPLGLANNTDRGFFCGYYVLFPPTLISDSAGPSENERVHHLRPILY